jgi:RND superfamily putative drug exporter
VAFAIVILIVAFGSVLAMGLPVGVALFGIGIGTTVRESVTVPLDTAGRSVLFAGTTVVISLPALLLVRLSFIGGMAIGAARWWRSPSPPPSPSCPRSSDSPVSGSS